MPQSNHAVNLRAPLPPAPSGPPASGPPPAPPLQLESRGVGGGGGSWQTEGHSCWEEALGSAHK